MAFVNVPEARRYRLTSARIPAACCDGLGESAIEAFQASVDGLLSADIEIQDGFITSITPAAESSSSTSNGAPVLDLQGAIVFPTFADLHTHIGAKYMKSCCPRCTPPHPPALSDSSWEAPATHARAGDKRGPFSPRGADKGHTCERSRNPDGSLSGADRSTAADADFWDAEDVFRWAPAQTHHAAAIACHSLQHGVIQ